MVLVALQAGDSLKGGTEFKTEEFGSSENVPVLIGECGSGTQVTGRVGAFRLETDGVWLVGVQLHVTVECETVDFAQLHVGVAHGTKPSEVVVGALQVGSAEEMTSLHAAVVVEHALSEGQRAVCIGAGVGHSAYAVARMLVR